VRSILTTIEVTIGKYNEKLSLLIEISPGNFPKKLSFGKIVRKIPAINITDPNIIKYLPRDCNS